MRRAILAAVAAVLTISAGAAQAEPTLGQYQTARKLPDFSAYMIGLDDGISWANANLASLHEAPLYCQPGKLALTVEQSLSILDAYIAAEKLKPKAKNPFDASSPIGVVYLFALKDAFPCPTS